MLCQKHYLRQNKAEDIYCAILNSPFAATAAALQSLSYHSSLATLVTVYRSHQLKVLPVPSIPISVINVSNVLQDQLTHPSVVLLQTETTQRITPRAGASLMKVQNSLTVWRTASTTMHFKNKGLFLVAINIYHDQHCLLLYLGAADKKYCFRYDVLTALIKHYTKKPTPKIIRLMLRLVQLSTLQEQDHFGSKVNS